MATPKAKPRTALPGGARKRGVTLIEAVLYISIALSLIVGGLVFFQQASLAQRTNSAVRNISAIASEVRGLYQGSTSFNGVQELSLIRAGAIPSSLIDPTLILVNEWGGLITIRGSAQMTNGPRTWLQDSGFTITYHDVPETACTRLTSTDITGAGRVGSGIRAIGIWAPPVAVPAAPGRITGVTANWAFNGELNQTAVGNLCRGAANLGTVADLVFWFDR